VPLELVKEVKALGGWQASLQVALSILVGWRRVSREPSLTFSLLPSARHRLPFTCAFTGLTRVRGRHHSHPCDAICTVAPTQAGSRW
jgi:hypothetical protein